jgi:hypothetical protein
MFNFRSNSSGEEKALKTMATICPIKDEEDFAQGKFSLEEDDVDAGWFFECKMCKGAKCSGYIRK